MSATLESLFPGRRPVLLDGAMGSTLQMLDWPHDRPTVLANLDAPRLVQKIHRSHRDAGARVITTNTFSALMVSDSRCIEAVRSGVRLARQAAGEDGRVAGSVAAFGLAVDDPQLEDVVEALVDEGVDLLVFETCNELRDAVQAFMLREKLAPRVPAVVCASTTDGGRADRERVRDIIEFIQAAEDPQVETGLNCCRGPHDALRLASETRIPLVWVKPSVGIATDQADDNVMAGFARAAKVQDVRFIGGCCGSTARTLSAMGAALEAFPG